MPFVTSSAFPPVGAGTVETLVLGLGNPILSDDGVGVLTAESLRPYLATDAPVAVEEVSIGGLTLMERMVGYRRVILIDAATGTGPVGQVRRMTLDELWAASPTQHSASPHDASLATALDVGRRMGLALPEELIIYAIEVANITDFGEQLTPAVAAAVPGVRQAVLRDLDRWLSPSPVVDEPPAGGLPLEERRHGVT